MNLFVPFARPLPPPAPQAGRPVARAAQALARCLFEDILPLWAVVGLDHAQGGFAETIEPDGRAGTGPRRVRVSARQVYAFAVAEELGWSRMAARACVRHGYRFLCGHTSAHGFLFHSLESNGSLRDGGHELYDQAFLLLAYAHAHRLLGGGEACARANELLRQILARFPAGGGAFATRLDAGGPILANPHMHLLEAALAWIEIDDAPQWHALANRIVHLFSTCFYDRRHGAVLEAFDLTGKPLAEGGRYRVEPGHNFEWAWLLMRWERLAGGEAGDLPHTLIRFAETHGVDPARRVAVNAVWHDGSSADIRARLWPQTERLKAWLALAEESRAGAVEEAERKAAEAAETLLLYLRPPTAGLWHDVMEPAGTFAAEPAPASSLYHIACAIREILAYAGSEGEAARPLPAPRLEREAQTAH